MLKSPRLLLSFRSILCGLNKATLSNPCSRNVYCTSYVKRQTLVLRTLCTYRRFWFGDGGFWHSFWKGERIVNIDLAQLKKMQAANDIQLIDVREPVELEEAGRIPGATNIPLGDVEEAFLMDSETFLKTYNIKKPKKSDANIVFTCRSGVRSLRAVKIVEELGYKPLNFKDGYLGWAKEEL